MKTKFAGVIALGLIGFAVSGVAASISGTVKDRGTGSPVANAQVSTSATPPDGTGMPKRITTVSDAGGHYTLIDVPPGPHDVSASMGTGIEALGSASRSVTLAGADLDHIDLNVVEYGTINGKLIDENKDPVPGMYVFLVSKEYYNGVLGYFLKNLSRTDSRGVYSLGRVEPGQPFYLMTDTRQTTLPVHSEAPLDPALRKRVAMRTWYPNSPSRDAAQAVTLRAGEKREGVDIALKKAQNYCVGGILAGPNGPAGLAFSIAAMDPTGGQSNGGGVGMSFPKTVAGPDGEFRICDLYPGTYQLAVRQTGTTTIAGVPDTLGVAIVPLVIKDQDLTDLKIAIAPVIRLDAEVVLDGPVPPTPFTNQVSVFAAALHDTAQPSEALNGRVNIPGSISGTVRPDDYHASANIVGTAPAGLYIKDITYNGTSVRYGNFHSGSAAAGGIRVIVGQDGATFTATVTDKDGNPVGDTYVVFMPADAGTEAELAARIVRGGTDQNGQYTSKTIAPGKYYAVATDEPLDYRPETLDKIWQSHSRYQEFEVGPHGTAQVVLKPGSFR